MPFYDLRCKDCEKDSNVRATIADKEESRIICPECGSTNMETLYLSAPAYIKTAVRNHHARQLPLVATPVVVSPDKKAKNNATGDKSPCRISIILPHYSIATLIMNPLYNYFLLQRLPALLMRVESFHIQNSVMLLCQELFFRNKSLNPLHP